MTDLRIVVNGEVRLLAPGTTVARLVADPAGGRGTAVARGGELVPRSAWASTELADGDRIEILTVAQGG